MKSIHYKSYFAVDIKLHLPRSRKSPSFAYDTLHALGKIHRSLPTFYNQVHLINVYPNITHNSEHYLTYLIHASKQFTQIAHLNLFTNFLLQSIQQNKIFILILDNSNRDLKMVSQT